MENVWFTSDLHLGHAYAAKARGFTDVEEHDIVVTETISRHLNKKSKLFVLGDVAWNRDALKFLATIPGTKELIIGNHDKFKTEEYLRYFTRVHGFRRYGSFWLSHCPMHPQEIYRCKGNIHGHIHKGAGTPPLDLPYYNVNVDFHFYHPVNLSTIQEIFSEKET